MISLYTGAGGLDLGMEAAGFETCVAVDNDPWAVTTLSSNRARWNPLETDIHSLESREILRVGKLEVGEAAILVGGPPCQPFSKSAYWVRGETARLDDPRASTLEQYLRVLRDTQPAAFLLENVPGLGYKSKDEGLSLLLRTVEDINLETGTSYQPCYAVLNAADYGVPQDRKRLFVVGHREGKRFEFPIPTHGASDDRQIGLGLRSPPRVAWDAIGDLEEDDDPSLRVTGKWAELLPSIPEGENYLYHTERGDGLPLFGWRRRYWSFLLKLAKARASWTITAQPGSAIGPFHWKNRRLSIAEMKRLQTFPDEYAVAGGRVAGQMQLGNAVPSALAERLGREIRCQLFEDDSISSDVPLSLLPALRRPIPDAEPIAHVPRKYLALEGAHEAHPGTGRGPGAVGRER